MIYEVFLHNFYIIMQMFWETIEFIGLKFIMISENKILNKRLLPPCRSFCDAEKGNSENRGCRESVLVMLK